MAVVDIGLGLLHTVGMSRKMQCMSIRGGIEVVSPPVKVMEQKNLGWQRITSCSTTPNQVSCLLYLIDTLASTLRYYCY